MPATASYTYNVQDVLRPQYNPEDARERPVNLLPGAYERGTVLGQVTTVGTSAVQTLTITGAPTGGTFTVTATPPGLGAVSTVLTEAFNVPIATLQADLETVYGHGNVVVSGTAGTSYVITFTGSLARATMTVATASGTGLTGGTAPAAAIVGTTAAVGDTGTFGRYALGNADGTQVPKMLLQYPCTVDAQGNIVVGTNSDILGLTQKSLPAFYAGAFRTEELVGFDANAATLLGGHIAEGSLSSGTYIF